MGNAVAVVSDHLEELVRDGRGPHWVAEVVHDEALRDERGEVPLVDGPAPKVAAVKSSRPLRFGSWC
jgi:hypothetical protein